MLPWISKLPRLDGGGALATKLQDSLNKVFQGQLRRVTEDEVGLVAEGLSMEQQHW